MPKPKDHPGWPQAAAKLGISFDEYATRRLNDELWCTECRQWKSKHAFHKAKSRQNGHPSHCAECSNRHLARRREKGQSKPARTVQRARQTPVRPKTWASNHDDSSITDIKRDSAWR